MKNLSYSYVLHKFVELLGLNEYKACFPLLKSRAKLHEQDLIWRNIYKNSNGITSKVYNSFDINACFHQKYIIVLI